MKTQHGSILAYRSVRTQAIRTLPRTIGLVANLWAARWAALLAVLLLALQISVPGAAAQIATQPGPDGTPQFDRAIERRTYLTAGADELLTYLLLVSTEAKAVPANVTPEQLKSSDLRKR